MTPYYSDDHVTTAADRCDAPAAETHLWIRPRHKGGAVCIGGQSLTAEVVAERVWCEGVDVVMDEWCLTRREVLMACWWWTLHADLPADDEIFVDEAVTRYSEWCAWAHDYARNPSESPDPPAVAS